MNTIEKRREIIDRKALIGELTELVEWSGFSLKTRPKVLEIFKKHFNNGWEEVRHRFESAKGQGEMVMRSNAYLVDQIIRTLHEFALQHAYPMANPTSGEQVSVLATGGYGRGELAPQSDVDLMFLLPYKQTSHTEQVVEFMLYMLWDLGLKVGHATRSIDEAVKLAKEDLTICTSMLESRLLSGDEDLFLVFKDRFNKDVLTGRGSEFVDEKLQERDARHERLGDTRYVLEPNIKEGKGGLRDLQTLHWIAKYLYKVDDMAELVGQDVFTDADAKRFAKAESFLWTVRCHLHYLSGRPDERLTFNVQEALAERMGYTDHAGTRGVERFMKHYFLVTKEVGDLTRILCAVLEEQHKKKRFRLPSFSFRKKNIDGFTVEGDRINVESDSAFEDNPTKLVSIFVEAQKNGLDIHPEALRLIDQSLNLVNASMRQDPEANRLFLELLTHKTDAELGLRQFNDADVFGRFIPDFGRVVAQMQYDMYHVYTVDEHTIRAIGLLNKIDQGLLSKEHPVSTRIIHDIQSRRALYVAVLLHDIAKGRGGDHSILGADVALKLCPRFGLNDWETETVAWLVRHHLDMSNIAFKRDIDDPKTVEDFVDIVQSPERLRLLTLLTVVDIKAVGPSVWNAWKAGLLAGLYFRAMEFMTGGIPEEMRRSRIKKSQHKLIDLLQSEENWDEAAIQEHINRGHANYWLTFDTKTLLHHAKLIKKAEDENLDIHIETRVDKARDMTEIIVYTPDHPGLFARIAGAMALSGASIVDAKVTTLANSMALDTFSIQDGNGHAFDSEANLKRLWSRIEEALRGTLHTVKELEKMGSGGLPSRTEVFTVPPRVLVDNKASSDYTVIEVNGRDRPGFLHDVTRALNELGMQIGSAHISTYGERVVDVFYVKDIFGLKVEGDDKLQAIGQKLFMAISPTGEAKGHVTTTPDGPDNKEIAKKNRKAASKAAKAKITRKCAPAPVNIDNSLAE